MLKPLLMQLLDFSSFLIFKEHHIIVFGIRLKLEFLTFIMWYVLVTTTDHHYFIWIIFNSDVFDHDVFFKVIKIKVIIELPWVIINYLNLDLIFILICDQKILEIDLNRTALTMHVVR